MVPSSYAPVWFSGAPRVKVTTAPATGASMTPPVSKVPVEDPAPLPPLPQATRAKADTSIKVGVLTVRDNLMMSMSKMLWVDLL